MADTVNTNIEFSGKRRYFVRLSNKSDGTGESGVTKVTKSGITNSIGVVPAKLNVRTIQYTIQGFSSVQLFWDHTAPDLIDNLGAGVGYRDYTEAGCLVDPASAGGTGNITLTTNGAVSGATYDILLELVLSD